MVVNFKDFKLKLDGNVNKEYYLSEYLRIKKHFLDNTWSIQSICGYIVGFMDGNILHDDLLDRCLLLRTKKSQTLDNMILRYGNQLGSKKWKSYCDKQANTNSFEYKKEKFGMTELDFLKFNKSRAVTLDNMILRYGETVGHKKWKSYCDKQKYNGKVLPYYIEKYGNTDGVKKYNDVCSKKANTIQNFINRYGELDGMIRYDRYISSVHTFASKMSQNLCWNIYDNILTEVEREHCYFAEHKNEFGSTMVSESKQFKYFKYDFVITDIKYCLEFNGDVFHANPKMFIESDTPNPYNKSLNSKQIWDNDIIKNNHLRSLGYYVDIIWETDYINFFETEIKRIQENINACRNK